MRLLLAAIVCGAFICFQQASFGADSKGERIEALRDKAKVASFPATPWAKAFAYKSKNYEIHTNTSKIVATYLGVFMDQAQARFHDLFDYDGEVPTLVVNAYRTEEEFRAVARQNGLTSANIGGFFYDDGKGSTAIYLPYLDQADAERTLLHEGTHQFVHMSMEFVIPPQYKNLFVSDVKSLPTVPIWLNEGLATYVESTKFENGKLLVGGINNDRLLHLQRLIEEKKAPTLEQLFKTEQKDFTVEYYAVAWGVVYWFLKDPDKTESKRRRKVLKNYVEACKKAFFDDPAIDFGKKFPVGNRGLAKDFGEQWRSYVREEARSTFMEMTIGDKVSMEKWESIFRKWISERKPDEKL